jgi:hypothetical protein
MLLKKNFKALRYKWAHSILQKKKISFIIIYSYKGD